MSEKNKTKNESPDDILNGTEYEWLNDVRIPYNVIPKERISPKIKKLQENFETIPQSLVPQRSQKDLDTDKKIIKEHNQKTNEPKTYTSQLTVNLKPVEKSKVAPKSIIKANNQTEEPYGKNVADKKLLFESLSNTQESKANSKVGKLKDDPSRKSFMEQLNKEMDQKNDTSRNR